jgi:hypothetical protein
MCKFLKKNCTLETFPFDIAIIILNVKRVMNWMFEPYICFYGYEHIRYSTNINLTVLQAFKYICYIILTFVFVSMYFPIEVGKVHND